LLNFYWHVLLTSTHDKCYIFQLHSLHHKLANQI